MTDLGGVVPSRGGRIQLKLRTASSDRADYDVVLGADGKSWQGRFGIELESGIVESELEGDPPAWLLSFARAVARNVLRQATTDGWPRRVTRWRAPPSDNKRSER